MVLTCRLTIGSSTGTREGLGRLQLGSVGRQVDEPDALGDGERQGVQAGAVEDDNPVATGSRLAGEEGEGLLEELPVDASGEIPVALAGGRGDEGSDVEPLEAVVAAGDRALAPRRLDPAQDRLQADPVLVGGAGLDHRAGRALRLLCHDLGKLF